MNKKLFVLLVVLMLFLGLCWAGSAKAGISTAKDTLIERLKAGKTIKPGEYIGEKLNHEEADYYKIEVKPGQQIKIYGSAEYGGGSYPHLRFTLYNEEGIILSREKGDAFKDPASAQTVNVFYLPGSTEEISPQIKSNIVFFEAYAGGYENSWIKGYSFSFALDTEKTDAGFGTDAGDDFGIAQDIKPGDYPKNFLAKNKCEGKYCSTDHKDMYKISVKAKERLTIKVTPDTNLQSKISFFNELKENQPGGKEAANKGAIVEASYISPKDQDVYFDIRDTAGEYYGSYGMKVAVKTATAKELEEAGMVEEEIVPEKEIPEVIIPEEEVPLVIPEKEIPEAVAEIPAVGTFVSRAKEILIWLVIGVIVFIGIVVAVIVLVVRARKKKPPRRPPLAPPKPPISLPTRPSTGSVGPAGPALPKVPPTTRATLPTPPEVSKPPAQVSPPEPAGPKPPSEEGVSGMILPPKELRGK